MLINQNGQTNVRDVRIKQYSHDADSITVAVDRSRAGHDLSALPLQLLIEASDVMDVVEEGVDDALFKVVNEDSIEITWRPQGRHTTGSERIMCQIVFADCGNVIAYTDTFAVIVEKSLKQVKDCIYADGYTMLDQYLKRLASIRNEAEEIKNATKEAAKQAQESAASAERSAGEASESAKAVAADKQEVEHLLNKVQTEAGDAENAQRGAEVAAGRAREFAGNAAGFASASEVSAQKAETSAAEAAESAQGAATIKQEVIKAGQDVIVEIAEAKETVLAVGRDAVKNIGISKDIAIKEVQDAATEITADREQIGKNKEDITDLTAGLADLRKCKAGVIVDEVSGISILIQDSAEAGFERLTLHGKSTQGSTTGAQLFDILTFPDNAVAKGVTIANNHDGSFTVSGTKTEDGGANLIGGKLTLPAGTYTLSGNTSELYVVLAYDGGFFQVNTTRTFKTKTEFQMYIQANETLGKTITIFPMLNSGSTALPWEPYTGGKPSPSPEYPQGIESAGKDGEIEVEVLGKNLIPFPYPILGGAGTQIERGGVKYTVQSDGGIRCVGTPTAVEYINLSRIKFSDVGLTATHPTNGKIVLSGEKMAYDASNHTLFIYITSDQLGKPINTVIYPQIEFGTVATEYEPYKPAQTLIIPTPGGLPGIPVSSGGNYTDKDGQQWVCDEIDLARGERVQRIEKLDLKSLLWSKQSRASNASGFWFSSRIKSASLFGANVKGTISNIGRLGNPYNMIGDYVWALTNAGNSEIRIGFADSTIDSLEKLTNLLNSLPEAYAMYCLAEPIRTPLPPETIAAYKSLKTYSPTTTVINDAGAGMSVGYVADTKLYIDKKIDGVMKALANTQAHLL